MKRVLTKVFSFILIGAFWFQFSPAGKIAALPLSGTTERVSVSSSGEQANSISYFPSISADGRYVAFCSVATNLVSGDINDFRHIYVHDRQTGTTQRVSVSTDGELGDGDCGNSSLSADGSYVAFESQASNLVSGDTNHADDVFVHNRQTGITERVSVSSSGEQGNGGGVFPSISADGHLVAFISAANNLVSGDTNGYLDIFVHDLHTGVTDRVSLSNIGEQGNGNSWFHSVSADGRFVAFESVASNLVNGDTNGYSDIFVRDRQAGTTERVSISSDNGQGDQPSLYPSISADGRYVTYYSNASSLVIGDTNATADVFIHDRQTGTTERVSLSSSGEQSNDASSSASISADGHLVSFISGATNLVDADTDGYYDIFVHNCQSGATERVSVSSSGEQSNNHNGDPYISADGRFVAFESFASNLVSGDTNGSKDVFVHDRCSPGTCIYDFVYLPLVIR